MEFLRPLETVPSAGLPKGTQLGVDLAPVRWEHLRVEPVKDEHRACELIHRSSYVRLLPDQRKTQLTLARRPFRTLCRG